MKLRDLLAGLAIVVLGTAPCAWGGDGHSADGVPPGQGSGLSMSKFYTGTQSKLGTYPGKLICLRCDLGNSPDAMKQCAAEGHRHVLSMDQGAMIHPLIAGTKEVSDQLNSDALHGKMVNVHGNYYTSTGWILADKVTAAP